jgi:hypothetical protein
MAGFIGCGRVQCLKSLTTPTMVIQGHSESGAPPLHPLANRIRSGESGLRHGLVDHANQVDRITIRRSQAAPGDDACADGFQVVRADVLVVCIQFIPLPHRWTTLDRHARHHVPATEWNAVGRSNDFHTGNSRQSFVRRAPVDLALLPARVLRRRQRHAHGQQLLLVEAKVRVRERAVRANEEHRANQQYD